MTRIITGGAAWDAYVNHVPETVVRPAAYSHALVEFCAWQARLGTVATEDDFEQLLNDQRACNRPRPRGV